MNFVKFNDIRIHVFPGMAIFGSGTSICIGKLETPLMSGVLQSQDINNPNLSRIILKQIDYSIVNTPTFTDIDKIIADKHADARRMQEWPPEIVLFLRQNAYRALWYDVTEECEELPTQILNQLIDDRIVEPSTISKPYRYRLKLIDKWQELAIALFGDAN